MYIKPTLSTMENDFVIELFQTASLAVGYLDVGLARRASIDNIKYNVCISKTISDSNHKKTRIAQIKIKHPSALQSA